MYCICDWQRGALYTRCLCFSISGNINLTIFFYFKESSALQYLRHRRHVQGRDSSSWVGTSCMGTYIVRIRICWPLLGQKGHGIPFTTPTNLWSLPLAFCNVTLWKSYWKLDVWSLCCNMKMKDFIISHNLFSCWCMDDVERKLMLVTIDVHMLCLHFFLRR